MPTKLDRCVKQVMSKGNTKSSAYAICSKSTGYVRNKKGGWTKKKKGK